jgi:hypothetical protein
MFAPRFRLLRCIAKIESMVDAQVKKWNERVSIPLGGNYAPPFNIAITRRVTCKVGNCVFNQRQVRY